MSGPAQEPDSSPDEPGPDEPGLNDPGVDELAQAADALFLAMRRARAAHAAGVEGLSLAQLALVLPLATGAELPVSDLAAAAGVTLPTATRMLNQLEGKRLVARRRSPEDERRVLISLTERGTTALHRLREQRRREQARGYAAFTPEERLHLAAQLERLTEIINSGYREQLD
ncbi:MULTISPECIES: MarR family winged helix-turn-helix transcriptional regulator [unclassified Saccharopolyspora]|uniref:MarR family winged helix-turn-helix transcriptional regulator n=1 Tax=unclassified Saccharopolyspora TaxID=2646250 RepID=UPI00272A4468|nr:MULTISPECIES: MarR family transcriptional regulator [unclassified Saccharopolyspora]